MHHQRTKEVGRVPPAEGSREGHPEGPWRQGETATCTETSGRGRGHRQGGPGREWGRGRPLRSLGGLAPRREARGERRGCVGRGIDQVGDNLGLGVNWELEYLKPNTNWDPQKPNA